MKSSITSALQHIREFEGGYVNDPHDPGGCTNMGITIGTYRRHLNPDGTCQNVRDLSWAEAEAIYRAAYWDLVRGDDLPPGLDLLVFDHGVNAGVETAVKMLQRLVGAIADGQVGAVTLARVDREQTADLIRRYTTARISYYRSLKTWRRYGKGWTRRARAAELRALALAVQARKAG